MSIRHPSSFVTLTFSHPKVPFGRVWLPVPSLLIYLGAWAVRIGLWVAPRRMLRKRDLRELPVDARQMGRMVTKLTWALLCSGSYVLVDVRIPNDRVRVRIRLI